MHLHFSPLVALAVFPLGLYWGWVFHRHQNLVGVSVSHTVVGLFGFGAVGFDVLLP